MAKKKKEVFHVEQPAQSPGAEPDPFAQEIEPEGSEFLGEDAMQPEPQVSFPEGTHNQGVEEVPDRARAAIETLMEEQDEGSPEEAVRQVDAPGPATAQAQSPPAAEPLPSVTGTVSLDDGLPHWTVLLIHQPWGYEFKKVGRMTRSEAWETVRRNEWNRAGRAIIIQGARIL
jgi:hypothetical protein